MTSASLQATHHAEALKFFKAFTKMKEEFVSMLQFVSKHRDYVSALDELSMSFSRMVAAAPNEKIDPSEEHFKMHIHEAPMRIAMLAATHSEGCVATSRSPVTSFLLHHAFTESLNTIARKPRCSFFKHLPPVLTAAIPR